MAIVPSRDRPQSMLVNLEGLGLPNLSDVGVVLAASLLKSGTISSRTAARMADKPLAEMLMIPSNLSIPLTSIPKKSIDDLQAKITATVALMLEPASWHQTRC
ncbi:hypothetical protein EHV23_04685 [Lautropia dentalis]|uniref:Uncharacterized protein n=1 Tax=Lautropia dentalis TaxID=2490857 RepID=A0A426FS61_9BURK|nr:hypothetical protein [Lautropia dentalis]RRN45491.1 hypothetical protein EHV23_04685 [Lautropia dentalis]